MSALPTDAPQHVTKIKFGTDGWRAAIAEDYTFHNVRRCARGVAEYLQRTGTADRGVVVCHDRRFASEHFARACVEVLAAHDIRSFTAARGGADPGRQLLHRGSWAPGPASSSPPATTRGPTTASRSRPIPAAPRAPEMLAAIEATMDAHPEDELPPRRDVRGCRGSRPGRDLRPVSARSASSSTSIVDLERIRAAERRVLVEPLYGSGAGWFTRLLGDGRLTVRELHTERNPFFGGVNPEPIRPNIDAWLEEIPRWGADIGIAFDGDADRVGHGDRGGRLRQPAAGLRAAVLVPARGARADRSGGLHRHHHLHGAEAGRDLRHAGVRDRGRASSTSGRR